MQPVRSLYTRLRGRRSRARRASRGLGEAAYTVSAEDALAAGAASTELGRLLFDGSRRPIFKWVHYLAAYERELGAFRGQPVRVLEIGVYRGGSLQLWRDYFGPQAVIVGIDIDPSCAQLADDHAEIYIGSQDDPAFLAGVIADMGGVDIIIDDGSHVASHQQTSFEFLFPHLEDGGVYVVEDLHTSYWRDYGGGYRKNGAFIEYVKEVVDDMHAWYHNRGQRLAVDAANAVGHISLYDSIAFIHKSIKTRPAVFLLDKAVPEDPPPSA